MFHLSTSVEKVLIIIITILFTKGRHISSPVFVRVKVHITANVSTGKVCMGQYHTRSVKGVRVAMAALCKPEKMGIIHIRLKNYPVFSKATLLLVEFIKYTKCVYIRF